MEWKRYTFFVETLAGNWVFLLAIKPFLARRLRESQQGNAT